MTGRTAEAVTAAEAGFTDHVALGDELAIAHPATHIVNQVFALTEAGRLTEAEQLARAGVEIVASHRVPIAQIWFAANLGRVATLQGRVATARRYFAEAAGLAEANRFAGPRFMALSGLALAHAMLGDADAAAQALAERAAVPAFGFLGPEQQLADAWTALASRLPAAAADIFRAAAAQAAATGHRTAESWLWHDLMRASGYDASARLRELAAACDSPLVTARARHAVAARARDARELAAAAEDFAALGASSPSCRPATYRRHHARHRRPGRRLGQDRRSHLRHQGRTAEDSHRLRHRRRPAPRPGEQLMTPEQITLVQSSFERLGPQLPAMATGFYQELFWRDPALRSLFTTDLTQQEVKFAEKLTEIVRAMPRLGELLAHTRELGARHVGYGVRAADY